MEKTAVLSGNSYLLAVDAPARTKKTMKLVSVSIAVNDLRDFGLAGIVSGLGRIQERDRCFDEAKNQCQQLGVGAVGTYQGMMS